MLATADTDPADQSCLKCHDAAKLASLKKDGQRGPEIIPEDPQRARGVRCGGQRKRRAAPQGIGRWVFEGLSGIVDAGTDV